LEAQRKKKRKKFGQIKQKDNWKKKHTFISSARMLQSVRRPSAIVLTVTINGM